MKNLFFSLIALISVVFSANAQSNGGFVGPKAPSIAPMTVKQALDVRDDTVIVLNGKIINSLGDEKYMFADATGQVMIEIDDDDWHGVTVTPEDTLEITGEVDKEFMEQTKIDVKSFKVK